MAKLETLNDALLEELKDLYSAENQLLKALPKMAAKASNPELQKAFLSHLEETKGQVTRLEEIGTLLDSKLTGKTCKAMQGLVEEGKEVLEQESENEALIDALLIGAALRVEHYEIAGYSTARAMAQVLGEDEVEALLSETLDEEGAAEEKLSDLSEDVILPAALEASGANEDGDEDSEDEVDDEDDAEPVKAKAQKSKSVAAGKA